MGKEGEDPRRKVRPGSKAAMGRSMLRRARPPPRTRYFDGSDAPWRLLSCGYISFARPLGGAMRTARYCMRRAGGRAGLWGGGWRSTDALHLFHRWCRASVPRAGCAGFEEGRTGGRFKGGRQRVVAGLRRFATELPRFATGRAGPPRQAFARLCARAMGWIGTGRCVRAVAGCVRLLGAERVRPPRGAAGQGRKGCVRRHASAPATPAACGDKRCRRQGA